MKKLEETLMGPKTEIDLEALIIWYGNKLPQYLWNNWKDQLKIKGWTWQKFLKLLRYTEKETILWRKNKISWKDLINKIIELFKSELAEKIAKE